MGRLALILPSMGGRSKNISDIRLKIASNFESIAGSDFKLI